MMRFLSPAGAPLPLPVFLAASRAAWTANGNAEHGLRQLADRLGVRAILATCSGRAALWVLLRAMQSLRPKCDVVAIPAYTCFSVPAAIVRAGLKVYPVEMDLGTLDFDYAALDAVPAERLLAIVSGNLFGLVSDNRRIAGVARSKDAFFVDDAAQSLGAEREGELSGTGGDAGIYSLGRGKALAAGEGGLMVTNSEPVAERAAEVLKELPAPSSGHETTLWTKTLATSLLLHPRLYWLPNALPFLKLGVTEFDPDFPLLRMASLPQALLPLLAERLAVLNEIRRRNAARLTERLAGNPRLTIPRPAPKSVPAYIRFPVLISEEGARESALERLTAAGIGATASYPTAVTDIEGITPHLASLVSTPLARSLAQRILTLPTHPYVQEADIEHMALLLERP